MFYRLSRTIQRFVVKEKTFYTVIDYLYMTDKLFHNEIERECRGIKFCSKTGKLLARPYHKFHNLNERVEYQTANVDLTQPHVILDKIDGSMVHTCASNMGIYLMTRMGITEVAQAADKFMVKNPIRFSGLLSALPVEEYTYIFEYVAPTNKIVIDYAEEDLILTAIRHNTNGTYIFHEELEKIGKAFNIKVVQKFPFVGFDNDMEKIANNITSQTNVEGYVVRFDTGAMIKIKADEYVRKHRSKELIGSPKGMIGLIVENTLDDVLPQLDPNVQKQVVEYTKTFLTDLSRTITAVRLFAEGYEALEQKDYALMVQEKLPRPLQSVAFLTRKGCDPREETLNLLKRNLGTNKRIEEVCANLSYLFGLLNSLRNNASSFIAKTLMNELVAATFERLDT
jgi:T4 RnlA family RNA ligase